MPASVEEDASSSQDRQEEANDMKNGKKERITDFNTNKKVIRGTGESHSPDEDELSLYGSSDLDEQIGHLGYATKIPKVNFASNNDDSEPKESDEDDLIKDTANDFRAVEKPGPPIEKKLASKINNVMFNPVSREKLAQKLEKTLYSLKIKKCNSKILSEMLQSKTRSKDLKTQKKQDCILKAVRAISKAKVLMHY